MGKDYYAILGVPKGTSDETELKKGEPSCQGPAVPVCMPCSPAEWFEPPLGLQPTGRKQ